MPPRAAGLLLPVLAVLASAVPAQAARPPAAGAPGVRHTWAPADKHGFGTAHQLGGHAYFTLRQASLSEVYYPDLSTPAFRAAVRGDGDRHAAGPFAGVPPGHREPPLAADQDVDHGPRARQRAAARALRGEVDATAALRARRPRARQRRQRRSRDLRRGDADRLRRRGRQCRGRLSGALADLERIQGDRKRPVARPAGLLAGRHGRHRSGQRRAGRPDGARRQDQPGHDAGDRLRARRRRRHRLARGWLRRRPSPAARGCGGSTSSRCSCSPPRRTRPTAAPRSPRRTWRGSGAR